MDPNELLLGLTVGVGLAAACGFRIFVPLLVMSIAQQSGHLQLGSGFEWIGSWPALIAFGAATGLEVAGYYVPWVDNLLDTVATPAAGVAGTVVAASFVTGMDPMLQWSLAAIAGGGSAMTVQTLSVGTRALSTLTTGGIANPVVSTVEAGAATTVSLLAVFLAPLAVIAVAVMVIGLATLFLRRRRRHRVAAVPLAAQPQV